MTSIFHIVRPSSLPRSASAALPGTALMALFTASSSGILALATSSLLVSNSAQAEPAAKVTAIMAVRMSLNMLTSFTRKLSDRFVSHLIRLGALKPLVRPTGNIIFFRPVPFLHLPQELLVIAFDLGQIIVCNFSPLTFQLTLKLTPFPFEDICVHNISSFCDWLVTGHFFALISL